MKNEGRKWRNTILIIVFSWIVFGLAVYLTYSERWRRSVDYGASLFSCLASVAYVVALLASIDYHRTKRLWDYVVLWLGVGALSLLFGATGYFIEQSVYINADDPEKSDGALILFVAFAVGLTVGVISSASILGKHLLDTYGDKGPQK